MHDAVRVRVVMVEPKGMAELVDCGLRRPFDELVPSVVAEPRDRDDGKPIVDRRVPEDEVLAAIEEVHVGHEIGRASCRERVAISVVAVSVEKELRHSEWQVKSPPSTESRT